MKTSYTSPSYYKTKSKKRAFRFWLLFGSHYAYLGKWFSQVLLWMLLLAWLPLVLLPNVDFFQQYLGAFAFGLPSLGVFILAVDLLFIPYYVKKYNEQMFLALRKKKEKEEEEIAATENNQMGYPITY